jgi:hypothetical protein
LSASPEDDALESAKYIGFKEKVISVCKEDIYNHSIPSTINSTILPRADPQCTLGFKPTK